MNDDLAKALSRLWDDVFEDKRITELSTRKILFMEQMTIFIVQRDQSVWDHAYDLGKGQA